MTCVRLLAILVVWCLGASPALAISESAVVTATGTASVATVAVTAAPGSVLVALVAGAGSAASSSQTSTVSGCGLTWVPVNPANTRPGVAAVWKTASSAALNGCTVTARLNSGVYFVRLTVAIIADGGTIGASASASGNSTGPAKVTLNGTLPGSLIYGVGSDTRVATRTPITGQRILTTSTPTSGTFWAQALTGPTTGGSLVVGTSAPTATKWNFAAVEILAIPAQLCTFTVSPTTLSATANGASSNVAITASASTCAWTTASQAAWLSVFPSTGSGSSPVTVTAAMNTGVARTGTVTVAGQTVTVTQAAAGIVVPTLTIACPQTQPATSLNGQPVAVSYPTATTTGGVQPVPPPQGVPASGSLFPVGTSMVTQTASSSDGQTASCTFGVTVSVTSTPPTVNPTTIDITPSADYATTITTGVRVQYFQQGASSPVMVIDLCKPPLTAGHVVVTVSACAGGPLFGTPLAVNTTYVVTASQYGPAGESPRSTVSNPFELR